MAYSIQVVVDSADAHTQADWWAETLGWVVEPTDQDFIAGLIEQGLAREEDTIIHNGKRVWKTGAAICPAEEVGDRTRRRILFQPVPEGKTVKNRVHWDVHVGDEDKDEVRARLEARGATFLYAASQGPFDWYTMADPEGNEFCIS
ncbi:VOC family protein [Arthrobacter mobilis]|uniref:VOC family protein n=1 Tax=Arthrobacter mobilis TaxID=2724944 RepID=A0A7X6HAG6_9MICC|nr:VOC family protein [Arthrobacter mobilis]NKX53446.1 VOC family protein [Arthrobacter mobilis]